jgi:hypothetical protein
MALMPSAKFEMAGTLQLPAHHRYVLKFFEKLPPCLVGIEASCISRLSSEPA